MAGGGWCVCVFRGFGCEVKGVTGADLLLQVTILSIFLHHKDILQDCFPHCTA